MAGLDEARAYMAKREIPQLFESLMTALMYKKPDDHIKFLEECLSKAETERKIQWHTFLDPLPPIPKTDGKICSESEDQLQSRSSAGSLPKHNNPLPPISHHELKNESKSGALKDKDKVTTKQEEAGYELNSIPSIDDDAGLEEKELPIEEKEEIKRKLSESVATQRSSVESLMQIKAPIVFVVGGPGCGKGTQCAKIVEDYGFVHLSAGDLLRTEAAKDTETGKMINSTLKEGQLVPQEITIRLLQNAMLSLPESKGFLIDGFPRQISQGEQFEKQVKRSSGLIMFDCADSTLTERLLKRAETSGRNDDNEETIKKRLALFHEKTMPVVEHYNKKAKLIDANGTVDDVYEQVKLYLDELIASEENLIQVAESVASIALAEAEAEGDKNDDNDENLKSASELVEQEVIQAVEEVKLGDIGVSGAFAKEVLRGKEIVFVIGGPGCGKGTQCELIIEKFGHKHLSVGDLLRKQIASGSELGNMLEEYMKKGELVPIHLIMRTLRNALIEDENADKFLIDGFPRSIEQAEDFQSEIGDCRKVLYFHCPTDVMVERLLKRAEKSGRVDDNEETIKNRLKVFEQEITPIIEFYKKRGNLAEISAVGSPQEIFREVCNVLDSSHLSDMGVKEALVDANIVFVLGGPGSGKGTQCEKIVEKYGFCHLSTGDLLREEVQSGSQRAEALKKIMESGELVSQDTILQLLGEAMVKKKEAKGFLIDGFPRDVPQGEKFENEVGTCKFILYFHCSSGCMRERLLERAKSSGRVDDNEETIKKRLKTFEDQTLPVLDVYEKVGKVQKINAERGIDEIFTDVCVALDQLK